MAEFDTLENTTAVYAAVVEDEDGNGIPAAAINTMVLTLYDVSSDAIINSRDGQDVLNVNNVTVDASGNLAWTMQPADNAISSETIKPNVKEHHRALFEWTYSGGEKYGKHEVEILCENLNKVP